MKIEFETGDFMENLKRKTWEFKHDAEIKAHQLYNFAKENPQVVIAVTPIVAKVIKDGYRSAMRSKEQDDLDRRFWDPRMGRYARSKRKLTKSEASYVERQYKSGRTYRDILEELGLLQ